MLLKVTKKSVTDFYFQLDKNVAFGAQGAAASGKAALKDIEAETLTRNAQGAVVASGKDALEDIQSEVFTDTVSVAAECSNAGASVAAECSNTGVFSANIENKQPSDEVEIKQHFKRSGDALAAARERYLARKKAKEN